MVERDIRLAEMTGGRMHLTKISTATSVEAIRAATNDRALRAAGAIEPRDDVYRIMQVAYPACFLAMLGEGASRAIGPDAAFWAGVCALFWFSHAVMVAWADPVKAKFAWVGIMLSIGIVLATSWPAFAKRFGRKR